MEVKSKLYYKIGEVCEITGIEAHVLRYWESEFPVLHPLKNSAGQRVYRQKDIELVLRIKQLLYQDGFTIAGAKRRIRESLGGHRPASESEDAPAAPAAAAVPAAPAVGPDPMAHRRLRAELQEILDLLERWELPS